MKTVIRVGSSALLLATSMEIWAQQAGGTPSVSGMANAANYGPVAPGSIAAVFGTFNLSSALGVTGLPLPTSLEGMSLRFGDPGSDAPLFFVSSTQANVQIPWTFTGGLTWLTAIVNGQTGAPSQTFTLVPFAPGIFSMNAQGNGQGAILNSQYYLVDSANPAQAGDAIQIYATGLGAVTNQPATGFPALSSPLSKTTTTPTVTIGGAPATVLFSGLAPGNVGLYQVNAQIPSGITPGLAVPVSMSIGGADSNTVTIAVGSFPHYTISTVAGGLGPGYSGDGGLAVKAQLSGPGCVALDNAGNLYIADTGNSRVRKVSSTGIITTIAGNGTVGYAGDGGPALNAELIGPGSIALDNAGNLYISDDDVIRKVSAAGTITTVAGHFPGAGYSGDGGPAIDAQLSQEITVTTDTSGNIFIADTGNNRIRKISTDGIITTVAGGAYVFGYPTSIGDGQLAVYAELSAPTGIAVDTAGNLYIADTGDFRIRGVSSATGIITTVAGDGLHNCGGTQPCAPCGYGGPAVGTQMLSPYGVAVGTAGNLLIGDQVGACIGIVMASGDLITIAGNGTNGYSGDGGAALNAQLGHGTPSFAVDAAGNIYVADSLNNAVRLLQPVAP